MTTIKLKNGSGAPLAGDLVQGEPALDLTNKRLYTEDSGGTVIEVGTNPSTINIDAGTIDGTVIGGSTAAAITGTTITGTSFASSGDMTFGDNDKIQMGAGPDLEIYHDGTSTNFISSATSNLEIKVNGGGNFKVGDEFGNHLFIVNDNGDVQLKHGSTPALKLATTSTGIDVTGTVTADGLTVDSGNTLRLNAQSTTDFFTIIQGGTQAVLTADSPDGAGNMLFKTAAAGVDTSRMEIAAGGDISFYEDTGTTAKLFWDASAESLGIGTSSPYEKLTINSGTARTSTSTVNTTFLHTSDTDDFRFGLLTSLTGGATAATRYASLSALAYQVSTDTYANAGETLVLQPNGGNVGIGTSSPNRVLHVEGTATTFGDTRSVFQIADDTAMAAGVGGGLVFTGKATTAQGDSNTTFAGIHGEKENGTSTNTAGAMVFSTRSSGSNPAERMRIDSSGNLLVGCTSVPSASVAGFAVRDLNNGWIHTSYDSTNTRSHHIFYNPNGAVGAIQTSGSSTLYNTSSDYRLKENVVPLTGATERVKQLNPSRFNFIADANTTVDGFLAHEVADVVPEAITGTKDGMRDEEYEVTPAVYEDVVIPAVLDEEGNEVEAERTEQQLVSEAVMGTRSVPDYQGIDQSKLVPLLVATIQELEARITALESN